MSIAGGCARVDSLAQLPRARSCVMQRDDPTGKLGMKIGRDLMEVAGRALRANVTVLAPRVLPASEQLLYAGNIFARKAGSGVVH